MSVNYKSYEFRVYEHISQLDKLLSEGGEAEEIKQWQSEAAKLREEFEAKHFRVAVVGEFNRGKTTFVNALLGKEILPADYLPTTATINRITYSDSPNAYVVMKDGQRRPVRIEELAEYVTKLSASSMENALQVQEAVLEYPSLFCRNGVDLIDTPGMNDEDDMNQVTISRLEGIDLAIVAVDATMPFSMTECAFTVQLLESPQVCQIIIVATKIDMIRERERKKLIDFMVERIREDVKARLLQVYAGDSEILQKYHAIFDKPCVFAVSGVEALEALSCNNMELFEKSGFRQLNDRLPQIIMSSQNSNVILSAERELNRLIGGYREWLRQDPVEQQLNKMKTSFAQISYEMTANAFDWTDNNLSRFLMDIETWFPVLRKEFTQALGGMKELTYAELKRVVLPVIKHQFQQVNAKLHEAEGSYLELYRRENLAPLCRDLCRKQKDLLQPFPEIYRAVARDLDGLPEYFSLSEKGTELQNFYWLHSPMPERDQLAPDWNVMGCIDPVIREALADYRNRRRNQILQHIEVSKQRLDDRIQKIVQEIFARAADAIRQWNGGAQKERRTSLLDRLGQLEKDSRELKEKFLAEVG